MMWIRRFPALITLFAALGFGAAGLAWIAPAQAQDPIGRFSIGGTAGGGIFALADVEDRIDEANRDYFGPRGWKTLDAPGVGFNFAGDLRARIYGPIHLSIGGGTMMAESGLDFDEVISVKPSATYYQVRVDYDLPWRPTPKMRLRVGGGALNTTSAECEVRHEVRRVEGGTQRVETATFEGSGWGGLAVVAAEYTLNDKTTLVLDLAYRYLDIERDKFSYHISDLAQPTQDTDHDGVPNLYDLDQDGVDQSGDPVLTPLTIIGAAFLEMERISGEPVNDADGRPNVRALGMERIDFSGPILNVGLRFYLF